MKRVLFICTGNSARSQMAEGWLDHLAGDRFLVRSAGTQPSRVHPLAIEVMREAGIDISHHRSKSVEEFWGEPFDYVITVCDAAREACPVFPHAGAHLHWSFPDPAAGGGSPDQQLARFRRVRDAIRQRIEDFLRSA